MNVFLVLPFLFLLFGSSQESILPHERPTAGINTTLQTNFNGTYRRKNPCIDGDIETDSYVASHEFHHHIKENNWSIYTDKCSEIISSFLEAVGNLIRCKSKENGIFNFHINTSISQKQNGDGKNCDSFPTITIEAKGYELPTFCKTSCGAEYNESEQAAGQEKKCLNDDNTVNESCAKEILEQNPTKIISEALQTLKPAEKSINSYSTTPQCSTEDETTLIPSQDETVKYQTHTATEILPTKEILEKEQELSPVNDGLELESKNFAPLPGLLGSSAPVGIQGTADSSKEFFNDFSRNTHAIHKPEQISDFSETFTRLTTERDFVNGSDSKTPITTEPESESAKTYDKKASTECEISPCKDNLPNKLVLKDSSEYLTSPVKSVTGQEDFIDKIKFTAPEIQDIPHYSSQVTVLGIETTPQPTFLGDKKLLSNNFNDDLGEQVPDSELNKPLPNFQSAFKTPITSFPSTSENKFSLLETPFNHEKQNPIGLEEASEPLKPDFKTSADGDEEIIPPFSKRFQPAEVLPNKKISPFSSEIKDPKEIRRFVPEANRLSLQEQPQSNKKFDKINTTPCPTLSTSNQQNDKIINTDSPNFKDLILSGTTQPDNIPTYPSEPKSSSHSPQTIHFKKYDEPVTKPKEVENIFLDAEKTRKSEFPLSYSNSPKTSNEFPDYDADQSFLSTTPMVDYPNHLPSTPPAFYEVSIGQTSPTTEVTFLSEVDKETGKRYLDNDNPTIKSFPPKEENPKHFPSSSSSGSEVNTVNTELLFSKPKSDKNINEPIRTLDHQPLMDSDVNPSSSKISLLESPTTPPFDLTTASYNDPEVITSFQSTTTPKILPSGSLTGMDFIPPKTKLFEPQENNAEIGYTEGTIPVKYKSSSKPEFYAHQQESVRPESEPTEYPLSQISTTQLSNQTPLQKPPPEPLLKEMRPSSVLILDPPRNKNSRNSYSIPNDYQSKPQLSLTKQTPQPRQKLNTRTFSNDYLTTLPPNTFAMEYKSISAPHSEGKTFPEVEPVRNLALTYPNQVMTTPMPHKPTPYSEHLSSHDYTTPVDFQDSLFSTPKIQSFDDIKASATKGSFFPAQQSPDSLTKYSKDFDNEKPEVNNFTINSMKQSQEFPSNSDTSDNFYAPITNEPDTSEKSSHKFTYGKASLEKHSGFSTVSPNSESFTTYNIQSSNKATHLKDKNVMSDGQIEKIKPAFDKEFLTENQSSPLPSYRDDVTLPEKQPLLNKEATPDYKSSEYTEQVSAKSYRRPDFQSTLLPKKIPQDDSDSFEFFTTPLPPISYSDNYFYSSHPSSSKLQKSATFDEAQGQTPIQIKDFEPISYTEIQPKSTTEVYKSQTAQRFFNSNTQYSSATPVLLQKKNSFTSIPRDLENQKTEFITPSDTQNEHVNDSTAGFQQPPVNYIEGFNSYLNDANPNQFSPDKKVPKPQTQQEKTDMFINYTEVPSRSETSPIPQVSSQLEQKKVPVNSPPFGTEPQPQPQPSYNFTDIKNDKPTDNTLVSVSTTFDNSKTTDKYPVTFVQSQPQNSLNSNYNLDSNFRESPIPKFHISTSTVSYTPTRQPSVPLHITPAPYSVTDISSYQPPPTSNLEELTINSNQRPQENTSPRETSVLADNVSPQPQATTAVKYEEEIVPTQYQTSPSPNPQPQTTLKYANQLSDDNPSGKLPEFFTNQQHLVTSNPDFISRTESNSLVTSSPFISSSTSSAYPSVSASPASTSAASSASASIYASPSASSSSTATSASASVAASPSASSSSSSTSASASVAASPSASSSSTATSASASVAVSPSTSSSSSATSASASVAASPSASSSSSSTSASASISVSPSASSSFTATSASASAAASPSTSSSSTSTSASASVAVSPSASSSSSSISASPSASSSSTSTSASASAAASPFDSSSSTATSASASISASPSASSSSSSTSASASISASPSASSSSSSTSASASISASPSASSSSTSTSTSASASVAASPSASSSSSSTSASASASPSASASLSASSATSTSFSEQTPNINNSSKSFFQSSNEMSRQQLTTKPPKDQNYQSETKGTYDQIITSDYFKEVTPPTQIELPQISTNSESGKPFLPYDNQQHSRHVNSENVFEAESREQDYRINPSTGSSQYPNEYNHENFTPPQFTTREPKFEKQEAGDLYRINQSQLSKTFRTPSLNDEHPQSFIPYNRSPSMIPRIPDGISNIRAPLRKESYPSQHSDYNRRLYSNKPMSNVGPRPQIFNQPVPTVPREHFFYPGQNLNYDTREPFSDLRSRSHPYQNHPLRFPQPDHYDITNGTEFNPGSAEGFHPNFEPRRSFSSRTQPSNFGSFSNIQTTDSHESSPHVQQASSQVPQTPFPSSFSNGQGIKTAEALKSFNTTNITTSVTESPTQEQSPYPDQFHNKKFSEFQTLSDPARENYNQRRFRPSESLNQMSYGPPVSNFESRTFPQYPMNNPEPYFRRSFNQPPQGPFFPQQNYRDYDLPPWNQRYGYDEALPRDSQNYERVFSRRQQLYDPERTDITQNQPYFQARSQRPIINTHDGEPATFPPNEKEQSSNPHLHALESQMTLPFQNPSSPVLNNTNHQNEFRDTSSGSRRREPSNSPQPYNGFSTDQDIRKPLQAEPRPAVSDLTNPSRNSDHPNTERVNHMNRPLQNPFYEDRLRSMSSPEGF